MIVQKVLRSLPLKFDVKVFAIKEMKYLDSLTMDEFHGILTAYDIRTKKENTKLKEESFKALKKTK
jgi:kynurenine formamidase